jgi:hypothetical protein
MTANYEQSALARPRPSVESCWLCGTRLPVIQMLADGDSESGDVRWYCLDVGACTERWTSARRGIPDPVRDSAGRTRLPRAAAGAQP